MSTQPQILANRLNAQKSTGPQTPQGKAVVSQNALKHGLSARHDVITSESQADFDLHRDALLAELAPEGPMESILADRIVSLSWRLKRADLIQNQTFDAMHEKITNNSLANLAKSFGLKGLGFPQDEPSDSRPDLTLGRIALKDFSNPRVLDRLLMYERRIEHSLYKTTLELQRLRLLRTLEHPNATEVEPAAARSPSAPPFSRRRHDDTLTPNSTRRTKKSSDELKTPTPQETVSQRTFPTTGAHRQTTTTCIAQNKPNFKMGNINISTARTKAYAKEQRTMSNERHSKTNPNKANFCTSSPVHRV